MTHFDLKTLLPALLQVEDRVSMAVTARIPRAVAGHRASSSSPRCLPADMKFQGGDLKHVLKEAT